MEIQSEYVERDTARFPTRLRNVKPLVKGLWYKGQYDLSLFEKTVAIVGSRNMSRYGKQVLAEIVPQFVAAGYTTISGFMYGIDTEMHRLTMEHGGKTVAILGYGIDAKIDTENDTLYHKMMNCGCLVMSEYPAKTAGRTWTFPQRNRIVVGLSDMVVVVEAGVKSGSLNSASWARRLNKPVFALPGSIFSATSEGSNLLIAEGQAMSLTLERLSESLHKSEQHLYSLKGRQNRQKPQLSNSESTLIALLTLEGPQSVNELARKLGKPVAEVSSMLTTLFLRNVVEEDRGVWMVARG